MAIGTTAALLGAAAIGTVGSLAAGGIQANAANQAAQTQEKASKKALKLQSEALDLQQQQAEQARTDALPWMDAGRTALNQYMGELGLSEEARNGTFQSQFTETPGYEFAVQQGEEGVLNNLAALGQRGSGSALKALTEFRTGLANQTYDNYLNRLSGISTGGQTQVNTTNALGAQNAGMTGNILANMGNTIQNAGAARASGYVGGANAWGNALSGASNNISGALGMYSGLQNPANQNSLYGYGRTGWGLPV